MVAATFKSKPGPGRMKIATAARAGHETGHGATGEADPLSI